LKFAENTPLGRLWKYYDHPDALSFKAGIKRDQTQNGISGVLAPKKNLKNARSTN
jgi:hypothetical protein